jgi:hypothetical protein
MSEPKKGIGMSSSKSIGKSVADPFKMQMNPMADVQSGGKDVLKRADDAARKMFKSASQSSFESDDFPSMSGKFQNHRSSFDYSEDGDKDAEDSQSVGSTDVQCDFLTAEESEGKEPALRRSGSFAKKLPSTTTSGRKEGGSTSTYSWLKGLLKNSEKKSPNFRFPEDDNL